MKSEPLGNRPEETGTVRENRKPESRRSGILPEG